MADATFGAVPVGERAWSASNLLQTFSEAAAAVQPLSGNLGKLVDDLQSALTSPTKLELVQPGEQSRAQDVAAFTAIERPPEVAAQTEAPSSTPHGVKHSTSTLAVLSAVATSLKDKTHQVAQQQKRALSTFQQKGGLVGWLHGELEEADEHVVLPSPLPAPATPPTSPSSFQLENSCRYDLLTPPSPRSPVQSPAANRLAVEKSVGRRQSMPNMGSGSLLDNFFDKVAGATVSSTVQPSSPPSSSTSPRVKLRPSVAAVKSSPSSFDDFESRKQGANSSPGRHRAATTALPTHHLDAGSDTPTSPALIKARSAASLRPSSDTRFSLDDVLSDEWNCTVLWAHLYSSAAGRDHQHHQRLSFLLETTFRVTPLYRKLAGSDDACFDKPSECNKLVKRLKRLHSRFLSHHGAATLATSGVPVASPAASHAKNQLSLAVSALTELAVEEQVGKAISSLLQLAREVEREFRVLGTRSYTNFAESTLYRDFITHRARPGNIAALLRAARIPFYQQPNSAAESVNLVALAKQSQEADAIFVRAGCRAFLVAAQPDGSIKFTDISPIERGDTMAEQTVIQHTVEPFLNPSANVHPAASKPLAFNFTAGSGESTFYGAVMWLPVHQSQRLKTEELPGGLCIISKFPLVDSMRHFINELWKRVESNEAGSSSSSPVASEDVENASLDMGKHFLTHWREDHQDGDKLPFIDFKLDDLFDSLSLTNVLRLFAFVLLEKKIVLVASSYTILFSVSEALRTLLHPLVWSHVYVPVLPLALKDCLQCPTPFIFGLHDSYVRRSDTPRPSNDLVVVNLDRDALTGGGDVFLPPVRHSMLREELFRLCKPHLVSRDTVDSFDAGNTSASVPAPAIRRVFHKHLREILASLEPCVNRFELDDQCVSVVDSANSSQWPADTARFCSAMLHTQAVSTYLASTRSHDQPKAEQ